MMKEQDNISHGRGGKREGAGRPKTGSKLYTFRVPKTIADYIDQQENKTEFIKECLLRSMKAKEAGLSQLGEIYPASRIQELTLPYFNIGLIAGFPIPLDNDEKAQDINLLGMLCPHQESCYLIQVKGDSMKDADIFSGDIVIVDKSNRHPSESEVAVCELNGEYTLKRFVRRGDEGWLIPANPDYPEIKVSPEDRFSIWGTVTYVIHKPRD